MSGKKIFVLLGAILFLNLSSFAQAATDISCQSNVFYGNLGGDVHVLQMNSTTISDLGVLVPSTQNLFSLAFGNDITKNSTNRTLYSTIPNGTFTASTILRYTGTVWDSITTDSIMYLNAGAYGPFIYFQHNIAVGASFNNQCITRLNADKSLTKIFTDTTLLFTLADIAVDSLGNIYCFRGTSIGNTTEITVLNSNGNIINSFATNLNNLTTLYGAMFLNGTLYLGWNTTNGKIFPVIFSGSTASLGTPLTMPVTLSLRDLASCHNIVDNETTLIHENESATNFVLFPNPSKGDFTIILVDGNEEIKISNILGQSIISIIADSKNINFHLETNGVYFIDVKSKSKIKRSKLIISR